MKHVKKLSAIALSAMFMLSGVACGDSANGGKNEWNEATSLAMAEAAAAGATYVDPNSMYSTYDNKSYNEYLMGDDVSISPQWEGYGIGDPFIMRYNGMYYLYCSSLDSATGVRGYKSADLINWVPMTAEGLSESYVSMDPVTKAAYAPEVYYWNGTFYMYTSPGGNGHYILTSSKPEGPFVKATDNFGLAIDGSVFIDDNESMIFTYASNGGIKRAAMTDMLTVGTSTPTINNTSIGGWTEGSYMWKRDGIYYLTYTGNHVASDGYRIAYATSTTNTSRASFKRATFNPLVLETEGALKGVGHSSTVLGPDMDSYYLAYHMLNSSGGPNRSLGIDRLTFNGVQMSVAATLEGSVTPTLPNFYANGKDGEKFDESGSFLLSKTTAPADFTVEYNVTGSSATTYVFDYQDANNYSDVTVDLSAKTVKLSKTTGGSTSQVASGTLVNSFSADALHTVRIAVRDNVVDVMFDNMTKIDNQQMSVSSGKIGYKSLDNGATIGYTAYSDVAMGMSDEREAKQAKAWIGASTHLTQNTHNNAVNLRSGSGVTTLEEDLPGVKAMTLAQTYDYASYLVNFTATGRYGLEMVYRASDGGKQIGIRIGNGKIYKCTLPTVQSTNSDTYVKAIVADFNVEEGMSVVRLENVGSALQYVSFRFTEASAVTPLYTQSLATYADRGADYKTIWKLKDNAHYAKAGTRQLVYFGDNTITDFTLEIEIKLEGEAASGTTAGIVFHAKNYAASSHDSYMSIQGYYLSVNSSYTQLDRLNFADGSSSALAVKASNENPFKTSDVWVPLKIQVRGNTITVWSGTTQLFTYTDAMGFNNGKIGLYTNGAAALFRNLTISA